MERPLSPWLTPIAIAAFLGWLGLASRSAAPPSDAGQVGEGGSPPYVVEGDRSDGGACRGPVPWRVAAVDPRFGLDRSTVETAVSRAVSLWEEGAGRVLFVEDPLEGMPIRLIYDERQARTDERLRSESEVREADRGLVEERRALMDAWEEHHEARAAHLGAWAELREAVRAHNDAVRRWNERGGAPPDSTAAMRDREGALLGAQSELRRKGGLLDDEERALRVREEELHGRALAIDRDLALLARDFPRISVESGLYVDAEGRDLLGAAFEHREVRVFRFEGTEDLVRVLAHELGHALGLGHVDGAPALMAGRQEAGGEARPSGADLHALTMLCGDAWEGGRVEGPGSP